MVSYTLADDFCDSASSSSNNSKSQGYPPLPLPARPASYDEHVNIPRHPGFDRPQPGTEKLVWVHVPYTHTGWVPEILAKASEGNEKLYASILFLSRIVAHIFLLQLE